MWETLAAAGASGLLGYIGQREANDANKDIAWNANNMSQANAREQMAFQERMSNTTHAREVADLKNAGLNPILSVNAGAPAPGGAAGSVQTSHMENASAGLSANVMQALQFKQAIEKQKEEINLMRAQAHKTNVDAKVATKGIPAADITTKAYEIFEPFIDNLHEAFSGKAPKPAVDLRKNKPNKINLGPLK